MIKNGNRFSWIEGSKIKHRVLWGRLFQEDEVLTHFVRLTDDFSSKHEAIEWIKSIMEEVKEKKGD